jgi:hypothetical protein
MDNTVLVNQWLVFPLLRDQIARGVEGQGVCLVETYLWRQELWWTKKDNSARHVGNGTQRSKANNSTSKPSISY